jgi:hypothetical protein
MLDKGVFLIHEMCKLRFSALPDTHKLPALWGCRRQV